MMEEFMVACSLVNKWFQQSKVHDPLIPSIPRYAVAIYLSYMAKHLGIFSGPLELVKQNSGSEPEKNPGIFLH